MNTLAVPARRQSSGGAVKALAAAVVVLILVGLGWAESGQQLLAYFAVLATAVLPSVLWLRAGAPGIPVLPAVALAYVPYFAWPVLSGSESMLNYTLDEILRAGITVAGFLLTATIVWQVVAGRVRSHGQLLVDFVDATRATRFVLFALFMGVAYQAANSLGWLALLGSYYGLVRTIAGTFVTIACFLAGVMRGQGQLRGTPFVAAGAGVFLLIALSWSSLLLVGGIVYGLASLLGYVIVARRIPWRVVIPVLLAVTVLHAGKGEMRAKYWGGSYGEVPSYTGVVGLMGEWVAAGLGAIARGEPGQSLIERTSLLQMVLLAQAQTPDSIDYLGGATYAMLPAILVPRFIESDKPASQVGMDLLNVSYGVLTIEGTATTAIGWGLIAEGYANFGYMGVFGVAVVLGAVCGLLALWNANATGLVALSNMSSVAAMMGLISVELDSIQLISSQLQSFGVIFVFSKLYRWIGMR